MAHQEELALTKLLHIIEQIRSLHAWRDHFGVLAELQEELERSEQPQPAVAESAA
jgi:hypothetical protein